VVARAVVEVVVVDAARVCRRREDCGWLKGRSRCRERLACCRTRDDGISGGLRRVEGGLVVDEWEEVEMKSKFWKRKSWLMEGPGAKRPYLSKKSILYVTLRHAQYGLLLLTVSYGQPALKTEEIGTRVP